MADVIMYSTGSCPYCIRAKMLLESKHVEYTDIRVDKQPQYRAEMIEKSGRRTVPQIWINGEHVGGSDELFRLEQQGKLTKMLQQSAS